jgi:hypothetical protein
MQVEGCRPFTTNVLIIEAHTLLPDPLAHTIARAWLMAQPFLSNPHFTQYGFKRL